MNPRPVGTWLVAGLGNPGPSYAMHRHNVGYRVVEDLARQASSGFNHSLRLASDLSRTRFTASGLLGGAGAEATPLVLMKSRTFMNDSGRAVEKVVRYFDVDPARLVVVHDEIDLEPGRLRVKFGGGDNGHNGLKSIRRHLGTGDFYRVRVGVGRPAGSRDPINHVLSAVPASERESFEADIARAADAVVSLLVHGLDATQTRFNS